MKGVDGTRNGWISAEYTGKTWSLAFHESLENIQADKLIVDIPVALTKHNIRECDKLARKFLSPERHYSVFNSPVEDAVHSETYQEACDTNEDRTGKKISKQAWNIVPKIKEAEEEAKNRCIREGHPEVFFKSLEAKSVEHSKTSEEGAKQRKDVLDKYGDISVIQKFGNKEVTEDDLMDAMVLSLGGKLDMETIPENPEENAYGLEVCIQKPK
jgi:Uncharacterized conserved protein